MNKSELLIGGVFRPAYDGREFANINPVTEETIGNAADASSVDMEQAIQAARQAFDMTTWSTDVDLRVKGLQELRSALANNADEFKDIIVAETGSPRFLVNGAFGVQHDLVNTWLDYWIELLEGYAFVTDVGSEVLLGTPSHREFVREAVGVVAAITPWNMPHNTNIRKIVPALAAGCTVVLKPAPETPFTAAFLGKLIVEQCPSIPVGVFNVVTTSDNTVAELLSTSRDVDLVTFTGSTEVGRLLQRNGSTTIKRLCLELGGKSAGVVLDDADFTTAVSTVAGSIAMHAGQVCTATTRLLVPRSRLDEAIDIARTAIDAIAYGDAADETSMMGPLVSEKQRDRVLEYIEIGKVEAKLVSGGGRPSRLDRGFYVEPTLFADAAPDSRIATEEVFGPVLTVIAFDDDEDAIRIANSTIYGLSGEVWSADVDRARNVARRIRTGTISVNGAPWIGPDSPFGGYKQSGLGKEFGIAGFEEFLETKVLASPPA